MDGESAQHDGLAERLTKNAEELYEIRLVEDAKLMLEAVLALRGVGDERRAQSRRDEFLPLASRYVLQ